MRNASKTLLAAGTVMLMTVGGAYGEGGSPGPSAFAGPYVGVQGGYSWGDADAKSYWADGSPAFAINGFDVDGLTGGVFAGYNAMVGSGIIIGVEGEVNLSSANDRIYVPSPGYGAKVEQDWDASVRVKAGVDAGGVMPYVTGGIAFGRVKTYGWTDWGYQDRNSDTLTGWTIGAGVETAISGNIHARLQYRYTDYGSAKWTIDQPNDTDTGKVIYSAHILMLGVSINF
jgi:outer membrane immunogenic protein